MDSLYDNLENYNDANVIQELTNENNSLKNKLEEYATAMAKLQNDFDKLAADFKKLELNYSTLLKTARAEIERKTQVITNLNLDKDKMVLGTLQNRNILSLRKNMPKSRWERDTVRKNETDGHAKKTKELSDSGKSRSSSRGRKETSHTPSEDTITSLNIEQTNKPKPVNVADKIEVSEKIDISKGRNSDIKENITRDYKEHKEERNLQSKALSIKSRRKSMPATRIYSKFSSDDEREDSSSTAEANKKKLSRENINRKNYDRSYNDKPDYRETGCNTFHNRWNKKYDGDRGRDSNGRYEHRHRRHLSPERTRRRSPRNRPDDRHPHFEYSRKRALDSPPHNKHNRRHKSNYERENDLDKHGSHPYDQERLAVKQNYPSDYDEPTTKRMRTNSFKLSEEENKQHRQKSADHIPSMTEAVQIFEHISCQSPDYLLVESTITQPIREIKNTAAYPLEDPRENSKRYTIKTENGIKVLSTIIGRNVDLKPVDAYLWDMDQIKVADPLPKQPLQYTKDIVKEIYMDFDNPANLSLESGEILSHDQGASTDYADINTQSNYDNINICQGNSNKEEFTNINICQGNSNKEEFTSKIFETSSYRIPKINKNYSSRTPIVADKHKNVTKSKEEYKSADVSNHDNICPENQITMYEDKNTTFLNVTDCQLNKPMSSTVNTREIVTECQLNKPVSPMATSREMVEGDLELSDETCDNTDIKQRVVKEETVDQSTHKINNEMNSNIKQNNVACKINGKEISQKQDKQTVVKTSLATKKHKAKKKSQRQKNVSKSMENQETEEMKEKVKLPKEGNPRFPDLFGDSSSLITPEDLGLQQSQGQSVLQSPKYLQIFEDAQDGIGLAKKGDSAMAQEVKYTEKNSNINESKTKAKSSKSSEHKKKRSKKITVSTSTTLEVTENVDSTNKEIPNAKSLTSEAHVVQTVIISTGVQPQALSNVQSEHSHSTSKANIDAQIQDTQKVDSCQTQQYVVLESQETRLQALATSTPAKPQNSLQPLTFYDTPEVGNNSSEVRVNAEEITPVDQSSNSNTLDSHTEVDAPDVRIFIRRRKKGAKKTS